MKREKSMDPIGKKENLGVIVQDEDLVRVQEAAPALENIIQDHARIPVHQARQVVDLLKVFQDPDQDPRLPVTIEYILWKMHNSELDYG